MPLRGVVITVLVVLASGACASPPKPDTQPPARINDSVPERSAALRSASHLDQPTEEERWGIEGSIERKRAQKEAASASTSTVLIPLPPMDGGTPREASASE
jgi:hypothetical protein